MIVLKERYSGFTGVFESTSEKQNARIYILDHYDKATPDASK